MKKRYIAGPITLLAVALIWNVVLHRPPQHASAEEMKPYINPSPNDSRFPIEVYTVGLLGGETKADVLAKLPTTIYPEDRVTFVVNPALGLGSVVQVERAAPVSVKDGKFLLYKRTFSNTVDEFLNEINRPLIGLDRSDVPISSLVQPNLKIVITRVAKVDRTVKSVEKFTTTEKKDATMDRGQKVVETKGVNGERTKVFEDTREDGEVVKSVIKSNVVSTKPVTQVVRVGTKIRYGKSHSGKATWYDLCCKKVASNFFKKGSWVEVTNNANGKKIEVQVDDTGGFGSSVAIDLHPDYFKQLGGTRSQGIISSVTVHEVLNPPI